MGDSTNNSLVDLGKLAKPADTLIRKMSGALGGFFSPWQIRRIASAEGDATRIAAMAAAEASLIAAEAEVKVTELHRRATYRLVEEEARHQANMEMITAKALPQLSESANPDEIDDDWMANFLGKSRIVSNEDMQALWALILAGEANKPGSYSRRTVNLLADLDRSDCDAFMSLCRFCWKLPKIGLVPIVLEIEGVAAQIYHKNGITLRSMEHLATIGLVTFNADPSTIYVQPISRKYSTWAASYHGRTLEFPIPIAVSKDDNNDYRLPLGYVMFTKAGRELSMICGTQPIDGVFELVDEKWRHPEKAEENVSKLLEKLFAEAT